MIFVIEEGNFIVVYVSIEKKFLNITYRNHGPYKIFKSETFCKLIAGLFHQYNPNSHLILETFTMDVAYYLAQIKKKN